MTFESLLSKMGTGAKQITDRYAEYGAPVQDQQFFYTYEHQPSGHSEASSKHTYGGGHKGNAAMSALTLLAFLFFLHILQQCIKDHMDAMATTPQITIMTAGREGETALKKADAKIDKAGLTDLNRAASTDLNSVGSTDLNRIGSTDLNRADHIDVNKAGLTDLSNHEKAIKRDDEDKYLMKINTAQPPRYSNQNYMNKNKHVMNDRWTN